MYVMEKRLVDLEMRLMFMDDVVQRLTHVESQQALRIAALERTVQTLCRELTALRQEHGVDVENSPPPHY